MSEKRIRHFTFKIDIDYLIRAKYQNATATQVQALREQAFNAFCNDFAKLVESYKDAKGVLILHNKDTKHKKVKNRYILVLDEKTKQAIADDWHVHFVFWNSTTAKTEREWRKILANFGLILTDKNRIVKDFAELKKKSIAHAVAYLLHRTVKSIREHKYAYDESALNLYNVGKQEIEDLLAAGIENDKNKNLDSDEMTAEADKLTNKIRAGLTLADAEQESIEKFNDQQAQFWRTYRKPLEQERKDYIEKLYHQLTFRSRNFSLFYICGSGGSGKSMIADNLAYYFADSSTHAVHVTGANGKRKTPDFLSTYKNELVTVANELKGSQFSVDEYENLFEPHRFPTVNSRNNDKAYLAQATIVTNSMKAKFWLYTMLYDDYLSKDGASMRYGWKDTINVKKNKKIEKQTFTFPRTYAELIKLRKNKNVTLWKKYHVFADDEETFEEALELEHEYHWSLDGAVAFLDDWWQILRRMKYVLVASRKDKELIFEVYELIEDSKPKCLIDQTNQTNMQVEDFFEEFDFDNHYKKIGVYSCENMFDIKQLHTTLEQFVNDLKMNDLQIEKHLPKLMTEQEFLRYLGKEKLVNE